MAAVLVSDELWAEIEPLLPPPKRSPKGGRPTVGARQVLTGIVFVLRSGISWNLLPIEMGCGSGVTCWRRLRDWTRAGVWPAIHLKLLQRLGREGKLQSAQTVADSASVRAVSGGRTRDRTPPIAANPAANGIC